MFARKAYTMGHMKKNISILIGIVVLFAVLYGGQSLMKDRKQAEVSDVASSTATQVVLGSVMRVFEGEHVLEYTFGIPETATTTIGMDGALVRVVDTGNPLVTLYFSYEGGRGYSPIDYIDNVIAPHVAIINPTSTSTIGGYEWQGAESEGSEWYIAPVLNGEWLIVVENKKSVHDIAVDTLNSIEVK